MDGRGGCCIARYAAAGGHAAAYDMSQMDRIMLKYRPIAPKPAASGAVPASSDGGSDGHGKASSGRGRRKSSKDSNNNNSNSRRCTNGRKRKSSSPEQTTDKRYTESIPTYCLGAPAAVTLPLLPEAPDLSPTKQGAHKMPLWLSFNNTTTTTTPGVHDNHNQSHSNNPTVVIAPPQQPQTVVGSYVIVEAVIDTCPPVGVRVGDDVRALEKDTCPVIVSDGWNRVLWANEAYRRMVVGDTWQDRQVGVGLMMREKVPDRVQALDRKSVV